MSAPIRYRSARSWPMRSFAGRSTCVSTGRTEQGYLSLQSEAKTSELRYDRGVRPRVALLSILSAGCSALLSIDGLVADRDVPADGGAADGGTGDGRAPDAGAEASGNDAGPCATP